MISVLLLKHAGYAISPNIDSPMSGIVEHIIIDADAGGVSNNFARICVERNEPRWPSASNEYLMIRFIESEGVLHARFRHGPPCDHLACLEIDDSKLIGRCEIN